MKLFNHPFIKRNLAALGVAIFASGGIANAQFTGIGTAAPDAGLHVAVPTGQTPGTFEVIRIEDIIDFNSATDAAYDEVVLYDIATGLFRRESVADLLDDNGEWVFNTGTGVIEPRRFAGAVTVNAAGTTIGVPTSVNSTLAVTGVSTFNNTIVATTAAYDNAIVGTTQILTRNTVSNQVEYTTVEDLLEDQGQWIENVGGYIEPRLYTGAMTVNATNIGIGSSTTLTLGSVAQESSPTEATEVLIQNGTGVVEYVTIEDLLQDNGEWRLEDTNGDGDLDPGEYIYAFRSFDAGSIATTVTVDAEGDLSIGQANATAGSRLTVNGGNADVIGGDVIVESDQSLRIGAIADLTGDGTNATLTATGNYAEAITGSYTQTATAGTVTVTGNYAINATGGSSTINLTAGGGTLVQANANGLHIGAASANARDLFVQGTSGTDDVELGNLEDVTNVSTTGTSGGGTDLFERVLITDHQGVVRYINAADLVANASEWVYSDENSDGSFDAGDKIFVRRLGNDGGGDDVFVDGVGNMVVAAGKAYQFGSSADQILATGTAMTTTTGGTYTVTSGASSDVTFNEGAEAWLFYDADANGNGGTERGRVGINTTSPAATLHIAGNMVATNATVTSDGRFKRDIQELDNALDVVNQLRGVSYKFRQDEFPQENFDDAEHLGFIAQEIQEILPQTVVERTDGYLTVDYGAVTPVLVEAVQELSAQVEALQAENAMLRGTAKNSMGAVSTKQIKELEARLADMDARLQEVAGRK